MNANKEKLIATTFIDLKDQEILIASDKMRIQSVHKELDPIPFNYAELSEVVFRSCPVRSVCYVIGYLDYYLPDGVPLTKQQINNTTSNKELNLIIKPGKTGYYTNTNIILETPKVYILQKRLFII